MKHTYYWGTYMGTQGDEQQGAGGEQAGTPRTPGSATGEQVEAARAAYAARQEAEAVLAEASRIRAAAAADADAILVDAQIMADRLQSESLGEYERLVREATERADGILARARLEADRLRAEAHSAAEALRVRAESEVDQVRAQIREELREEQLATLGTVRLRSDGLLRDIESGVLGLGTTFERANASVADVVATIGELRSVTSTVLTVPAPTTDVAAVDAPVDAPVHDVPEQAFETRDADQVDPPSGGPMISRAAAAAAAPAAGADDTVGTVDPGTAGESGGPAATGSDDQPPASLAVDVPAGSMVEEFLRARAAAGEEPRDEATVAVDQPRPVADENATSFLGTDPPRPVTDWTTGPEVGAHAPATGAVVPPVVPGVRPSADDQTRPLGWLFRASAP